MTYEHLMNMTDNPQILEPLYFLREREVVHFQRFGECLEIVQGRQNASAARHQDWLSAAGTAAAGKAKTVRWKN